MKSLLARISQLDQLIYQQRTGNPAYLGHQMGISERSIFDYLKLMKQMGAPIYYSRRKRSYIYQSGGRFNVRFIEKHMSDVEF